MTIKITNEDLESESRGVSIRMPFMLSNKLKAEASLQDKSRDEYIKELLVKAINQ